jgi:hypothetical protein
VAVLAFSGDAFTPCKGGVQVGTLQYYSKYRDDAQWAIAIFRSAGIRVVLVGLPLDASPGLSQNASSLDDIYQSLSETDTGVTYDDAGQAAMANGQFTWSLPCLSGEPCTGKTGTNVVRSPDGVHFCPDGRTTLVGSLEECDVYSSCAIRFASAMLTPALTPPIATSSHATSPLAVCGAGLSHMKRPVLRNRSHTVSKKCRTAWGNEPGRAEATR